MQMALFEGLRGRFVFLAPDDGPDVVYEFYAPFAHVAGRYEWCRIRSTTHGVFDTFIVLGESTSHPAAVYVNSVLGEAYMQERYPECHTIRVAPGGLIITESPDGGTVTGKLRADEGPLHKADMELSSSPQLLAQQAPYGGTGAPVWGSRFTCWGVDLNLPGKCHGAVSGPDFEERFDGDPCIVTLGSFGRIAPR